MKRILWGFGIYFDGLRMWISHRSLLRLSIIPFFLDLICLVLGLYFTITEIPALVAKLVHTPEFWYQYVFYYLVLTVTALSLFFVVIFVVFIFANLLAFPFNDLLAEKTLRLKDALPESSKKSKGNERLGPKESEEFKRHG